MLNRVDLPAPLGPIRPVIDFGKTASVQRSTACIPPNAFWTSCTRKIESACIWGRSPQRALPLPEDTLRTEENQQDQQDADDHDSNVEDRIPQLGGCQVLELHGAPLQSVDEE